MKRVYPCHMQSAELVAVHARTWKVPMSKKDMIAAGLPKADVDRGCWLLGHWAYYTRGDAGDVDEDFVKRLNTLTGGQVFIHVKAHWGYETRFARLQDAVTHKLKHIATRVATCAADMDEIVQNGLVTKTPTQTQAAKLACAQLTGAAASVEIVRMLVPEEAQV